MTDGHLVKTFANFKSAYTHNYMENRPPPLSLMNDCYASLFTYFDMRENFTATLELQFMNEFDWIYTDPERLDPKKSKGAGGPRKSRMELIFAQAKAEVVREFNGAAISAHGRTINKKDTPEEAENRRNKLPSSNENPSALCCLISIHDYHCDFNWVSADDGHVITLKTQS